MRLSIHLSSTFDLQLLLEVSSTLFQLQELCVDGWGGLGLRAGATWGEAIFVALGVSLELLVVVFLHGELQDGVILGISLLGHPLQVAVGCSAQALQCSVERGGERGGEGREGGGEGGREGREGERERKEGGRKR